MNKVYKINPLLINKAVFRDLRKTAFLMVGTLLFYYFSMTYTNSKRGIDNGAMNFTLIFSSIIFSLLLLYLFKFKRLFYSNYEITINDEGISKFINFDNDENAGFMSKLLLARANRISPQNNILLRWQDIIAVQEKNYALYLKSSNAENFFGSGQIVIVKEIEGYDEIKKMTENHLQKNQLENLK